MKISARNRLAGKVTADSVTQGKAQRLLGRARSELEFVQPGVLLESLDSRLAGLQRTCRDVGEALSLQYFHVTPWVAWSDAGERARLVSMQGDA